MNVGDPLIWVNGSRCQLGWRCSIVLSMENNMTRNARRLVLLVAATLLTAAPVSPHYAPGTALSVSIDRAEARVGRPL